MVRCSRKNSIERYELSKSPLSQRPTQRDVAALVGVSKDDLQRFVNYKKEFIIKRTIPKAKGKKARDLAYPCSRLRSIHEKLKFHLNKIKQPHYLFSPRKGKSQRDNANLHLNQCQYLTIDLKQFYPSTSYALIHRWFHEELGMYQDVAGILTHICTVDGKVSFGSPLTPVLCTMVHRRMFNEIADACDARGLRYSLWVDDLTISGNFVPGNVLVDIRSIVQKYGLKTHKIKYRSGNRPVYITGVGIVGKNLIVKNKINLQLKRLWGEFNSSKTYQEREELSMKLISILGLVRYISGPNSEIGKKAANQKNFLKQKLRSEQNKRIKTSRETSLIPVDTTALLETPF